MRIFEINKTKPEILDCLSANLQQRFCLVDWQNGEPLHLATEDERVINLISELDPTEIKYEPLKYVMDSQGAVFTGNARLINNVNLRF